MRKDCTSFILYQTPYLLRMMDGAIVNDNATPWSRIWIGKGDLQQYEQARGRKGTEEARTTKSRRNV